MNYSDLLEKQARLWGLDLGEEERDLLLAYASLLADYEWANVIGTKDLGTIVLRHVLDSLSCFLFEPLSRATRLADVGSGGGLPGIPIKIARSDLGATLIEATGKKSRFLGYVAEALSLTGVKIANARAEDLARSPAHRESYDVVTTRAVAQLAVVAEYCVPLLKIGGCALCMKAAMEDDELSAGERAADMLGARISGRIRVPFVPEAGDRERQLVIIEKVRETPSKYPRRPGAAAKKPLGGG